GSGVADPDHARVGLGRLIRPAPPPGAPPPRRSRRTFPLLNDPDPMKYSQILGTALVALTMLVPATSLAAVPSITRIFPAGAAAGTSVDIELAGELAPWPVELISYPEWLVFEPQADTG